MKNMQSGLDSNLSDAPPSPTLQPDRVNNYPDCPGTARLPQYHRKKQALYSSPRRSKPDGLPKSPKFKNQPDYERNTRRSGIIQSISMYDTSTTAAENEKDANIDYFVCENEDKSQKSPHILCKNVSFNLNTPDEASSPHHGNELFQNRSEPAFGIGIPQDSKGDSPSIKKQAISPKSKALRWKSSRAQSTPLTSLQKLDFNNLPDLVNLCMNYTPQKEVEKLSSKPSKIRDFLYVGGVACARDVIILKRYGITHVVNMAGYSEKNHFEESLLYKNFCPIDDPSEDLSEYLFEAVEFIITAKQNNGIVLVHCQRGISRSISVILAYLIIVEGQTYDNAYSEVRNLHAIAAPNSGFCRTLSQLSNAWNLQNENVSTVYCCEHVKTERREHQDSVRIRMDQEHDKVYLPDCSYVCDIPSDLSVFLYLGSHCDEELQDRAVEFAERLARLRKLPPSSLKRFTQGQEPKDLILP